ncbi:MAG: glycerol-3-phosphate dehydrogenase/oxidase [Deltaproteobacteria bacterium]|nr:glycerol-3-phosphate dehydrogenase/oxidase [Deltaproteobacteria bacterium]MCB9786541.1 glycerol-3-phosphate dehydrogenase/oxidase [Deltaproteobacteria bacterium]
MSEGAGKDHEDATALARARRWARVGEEVFDLLVVGGGVTGCGVARDAALRGLSVALVEAGDYASGTSSKSSKLVHGGLRYLEQGQIGLVMESARERAIQTRLNPHLVWPQSFVVPGFRGDPHRLGVMALGLWIHEAVSLFRGYGERQRLGPEAAWRRVPGLRRDGLRGALRYWDCRTDDARLTLANALDAERHGALTLNYTRFDAPSFGSDGAVCGAQVRDLLTGRDAELRCRHIAYAAGPYTDALPEAPGGGALLRTSRGSHLVVPRARLPVDDVVVVATEDRRMVFAVPWEEVTYIGTTDTDHDSPAGPVAATADDIAYLLAATNGSFPDARLGPADVLTTWAGLRPLIRDGAATAARTSREHQRFDDPRGITSIAGGKLTTYRSMAEEVVDAACARLRRLGARPGPCRTARVPLDPDLPPAPEPSGGRALHLWRAHGGGMRWIQQRMQEAAEQARPLVEGYPWVPAEVDYATAREQAMRLQDVMVRRLGLFYRVPDQGLAVAAAVATRMAALLGRDAAWVDAELDDYASLVAANTQPIRELAARASR